MFHHFNSYFNHFLKTTSTSIGKGILLSLSCNLECHELFHGQSLLNQPWQCHYCLPPELKYKSALFKSPFAAAINECAVKMVP